MNDYEPVCGSAIRRSCSWCGRLNRLYNGRRNYCEGCGHRADAARSECDCAGCDPDRHAQERQAAEDRELAGAGRLLRRVLGIES